MHCLVVIKIKMLTIALLLLWAVTTPNKYMLCLFLPTPPMWPLGRVGKWLGRAMRALIPFYFSQTRKYSRQQVKVKDNIEISKKNEKINMGLNKEILFDARWKVRDRVLWWRLKFENKIRSLEMKLRFDNSFGLISKRITYSLS